MRILTFLLLFPLLGVAADDLEKFRSKQDRPGLERVARELQTAAEKKPGDSYGWYRAAIAKSYIAEVAYQMGDKKGSQRAAEAGVTDAEKAISLNGKIADYYRVHGTLSGQVIPANPLIGALAYGKRAKESLDKAIVMDPKSAKAFVAHGVGYYYLPETFGGGPTNAIKDFSRAISLDPKLADAWLWIGIAQRKLKQNLKARASFQKAITLDPDRAWAKAMLAKTPPQ